MTFANGAVRSALWLKGKKMVFLICEMCWISTICKIITHRDVVIAVVIIDCIGQYFIALLFYLFFIFVLSLKIIFLLFSLLKCKF
jgi:hypothetical protein